MAIGKTPQNQLDALPLQDADAAAAGGILSIVGGAVNRFWDPATLGINGVNMTLFSATKWALVTPYLDVRGCSRFVIALRASISAGATLAMNVNTSWQYRQGPGDSPAVTQAGTINDLVNGITNNSGSMVFPATAGASTFTILNTVGPEGGAGTPGCFEYVIGTDVRFILNTSTNEPGGVGKNGLTAWTCYIWGYQ